MSLLRVLFFCVLCGFAADPAFPGPSPDSLDHVLKAQAAREMGDLARARREYAEAAILDPSPFVLGRVREGIHRGAGLEELLPLLVQASEAHPAEAALLKLLGECAVRLGDEDKALEYYRRALVLDPSDSQASAAAAELSRRGGDLPGAGEALTKALAKSPGDATLLYRLAQVKLESGKPAEAEALFRKAWASDPSHTLSVMALGVLFRNSGRTAEAEKAYGEFLLRHPESQPVRRERAELYAVLSRWEESEGDYLTLVTDGFGRPGDFRGLGVARLRQGRALEALEVFNEGLRREPASIPLRFYKCQALGLSGSPREALVLLAEIRAHPGESSESPGLAALSQQEGLLYYRLDDFEGALTAFRRAATEEPQSAESAYAWGLSASLAGKSGEARTAFERTLELEPEHSEALYQVGLLLASAGDEEGSEKTLRKLLAKEPGHAEALNALGYSLAERGIHLDEAVHFIKKALQSKPRSPAYLDSLGWVHFKQGRLKESEKELRQAATWAAEDGEPDPAILDHLGDVLSALGKKDEAAANWRRVLELDPKNSSVANKLAP